MDQNEVPRLVAIREMAQILGVHPNWLYQRTRLGPSVIPHIKVGHYVRFDPAEVKQFLRAKTAAGNANRDDVS